MRCGSASRRNSGGVTMLLSAENVSKTFGSLRAVAGADLSIDEGEIIGLIGPNGAGKSTFFKCLAGDTLPTTGRITFDGVDVTRAAPEEHARLGIGRTFQVPATFEDMTVLDNVMVGAFLRHHHRAAAREHSLGVLELVGLKDRQHLRARSLGTPGRQRLERARPGAGAAVAAPGGASSGPPAGRMAAGDRAGEEDPPAGREAAKRLVEQ